MLRVIDPRQDTLGVPEFRDRLEVRLIDAHGRSVALPSKGRADGFTVATRWQPIPAPDGFTRAFELQISLVSHDAKADGLGIQVALALDGDARRFLVPGMFYGENRPLACDVRYPRFDTEQADGDSLAANHWSFRADRASHPVVLGWTDTECVALAVEERSALGLNGIGFTAQGQPAVLLNFPAREEPVTYVGHDAPAPPEIALHRWQAGEIASLTFRVFAGGPDAHAYDAVLRMIYAIDRDQHEVRPWMTVDDAAALTAEGLYHWHYRPDEKILAEAIAFERPSNEMALTSGDRNTMHVGWLSGAPSAFALLTYGRGLGIGEYAAAAASVLDTIASGVSPSGLFGGGGGGGGGGPGTAIAIGSTLAPSRRQLSS